MICWDRGRPARNAPQARRFLLFVGDFRASRSLRAGRPQSQQITCPKSADDNFSNPIPFWLLRAFQN